jgi:hypothetical protein
MTSKGSLLLELIYKLIKVSLWFSLETVLIIFTGKIVDDEKIYIEGVPSMLLYFKGKYYPYHDGYLIDLFIDFINR